MPSRLARLALALLPIVVIGEDQAPRQAPAYAAASIVNLASGAQGELAPNTLVAVYGEGLAYVSRAREDSDLVGGRLPTVLPSTGVTVIVSGVLASIEYVSPTVVTFLVPPNLTAGPATVTVARNALAGPTVKVRLNSTAPALFLYQDGLVLARHADSGEWVTLDAPAAPGETVILYATGLGVTSPPQLYRRMPLAEAPLAQSAALSVVLGGTVLDRGAVLYAGIAPGYPGVYEVRVRLPANTGENPTIALELDGRSTAAGVALAVQAAPLQPPAAVMRNTR